MAALWEEIAVPYPVIVAAPWEKIAVPFPVIVAALWEKIAVPYLVTVVVSWEGITAYAIAAEAVVHPVAAAEVPAAAMAAVAVKKPVVVAIVAVMAVDMVVATVVGAAASARGTENLNPHTRNLDVGVFYARIQALPLRTQILLA